jgi:hypothetical protein
LFAKEGIMKKHFGLSIGILIVALLLGAVLTPVASAWGPYGGYFVPGYGTGSLSTDMGTSWYFTYYPGASGYNPYYNPGASDYNYTGAYSPSYGYAFNYPYGYGPSAGYGYGFSYNYAFNNCYRR